jgi:hypothetical protein
MAWTTPTTAPWLAGHEPTSAELVTQVTNNLKAIGDPWTSYTPVWTAVTGTNPTIGNGTITGAYRQVGKFITFRIVIVAGTTTGFGSGVFSFTYPPFAPIDSTTNGNAGTTGFFWDQSGLQPFGATGVGQSTTAFRLVMNSSNSYMGSTLPVAGAVNDKINIAGFYEAA